MTKKLVQYGDSVALVIDRPIMEMLKIKITEETAFELSTDGKNLILSPQTETDAGHGDDFEHGFVEVNEPHAAVLERLGGMEKGSALLDKDAEDRLAFINFMIHEFAEAYKIRKPEGYRYLKQFGGLDYIRKHWWALHTDNHWDVIREVFDLCQKNGGYLR